MSQEFVLIWFISNMVSASRPFTPGQFKVTAGKYRLHFGSRDFLVHHIVFEKSQDRRFLIPQAPDKEIHFAEGSGLG